MENVLVAIIIIFILLFGALTISHALMSSQDMLIDSWDDMESRMVDQKDTRLQVAEAYTREAGQFATLMIENTGSTRLIDFENWDVIIHYYDTQTPADYHVNWLPYAEVPFSNEWTVGGIYSDAEMQDGEVYEPGIFNPGEYLALDIAISPSSAAAEILNITVAAGNASRASTVFAGNMAPRLLNNEALMLANHGSKPITSPLLATTDDDDPDDDLLYTVTRDPIHGDLSLPDSFTQAEIDNGLVVYTHTGTDNDSFEFTVTDGKDTIGIYTFDIAINMPPVLTKNQVLAMNTGELRLIDNTMLEITDSDTTTDMLTFTITHPPSQGYLSLMGEFTQADIDAGRLFYRHTGSGPDNFQFTITDGDNTLGTYIYSITVY
jgi:archaellum component FlaF (FlaF/FlaG flagellin family)